MRVLAVDIGTSRLGLAVSDPLRLTAQPLPTRPGGVPRQIARTVLDIVFEYERDPEPECRIGTVVVGHPIHLTGAASAMSRAAEECARLLRTYFHRHLRRPIVVTLWDERLTSVQADAILLEAGASRRTRKHKRDQLAAQLILQGYLDAQRHTHS
ncbi:MAG: Holliday junction resolvase RuvX [bacterium]|nr:Holliday junction resolvase RuvX [bacterium]